MIRYSLPGCSWCRGGGGDLFTTAAIIYTLGSVTIPSLASVYNEFALKKHMDTSVHEQNFFLYFYGAVFNLLGVFGVMGFSHLSWSAIFYGHSKVMPARLSCSSSAQKLGRMRNACHGVQVMHLPTSACR
jgi:hypothetical protein